MRFMLKFRFSPDRGNALAKEGRLGQTVQSIVEELNPEAAYLRTWMAPEAATSSSTWTTPPRSLLWRNPSSWG